MVLLHKHKLFEGRCKRSFIPIYHSHTYLLILRQPKVYCKELVSKSCPWLNLNLMRFEIATDRTFVQFCKLICKAFKPIFVFTYFFDLCWFLLKSSENIWINSSSEINGILPVKLEWFFLLSLRLKARMNKTFCVNILYYFIFKIRLKRKVSLHLLFKDQINCNPLDSHYSFFKWKTLIFSGWSSGSLFQRFFTKIIFINFLKFLVSLHQM